MPPLSFEPASEEAYQSSIFYTHSATLPGAFRKGFEEPCIRSSEKGDSGTGSITRSFNDLSTSKLQCSGRSNVTAGDPTEETHFSCLGEESVEMPLEMHPLESKLQTPFGNRPGRLQTDKAVNPELVNKPKNVLKKREEQPRKAVDQLAEKIADTVIDSSGLSEREDVTHDSMTNNPFIAQIELSRTPENLITEIRNSWRCAVQESELAQRKHQEEPVLMHPKCENHTNGEVQPEESSSVTCINLTGSINRNTLPDTTALCFGETQESWIVPPVKRMTCWSENTPNPDAEPTSSNCQSIRNEKQNQFLKPDRLWEKHVYQCNWEESRMDFSDTGSEHEPHCFSDKVTDFDTNEALDSNILPPPDSQLTGFGEDCHFASKTNVISNATLTDETEFNHSLQFLAFDRLRSKSPIKKEKLSKSFVMEMCKNEKTLENSLSSFVKCDLDGTLPWNGSENFNANLSSSTKPTVQPRFGILQETIPDLLDIDSLNSSKTMEVDQLDESHLDMQHLRSRLEQLHQRLATTVYGGENEHMGASDYHGDSVKDQNKPLYGEIDYLNEEIDAGKLFSLEARFLKDLSPMSLESQKFSLFPTLGSSPLNDPELEDGLIGISDLRPSNDESESSTDWERFSTDVGQLITF